MGCGRKPVSRTAFDCELKKQAINELPECSFVTKFAVLKLPKDETNGLISKIFESRCSNNFKNRLLRIIDSYYKMKWFQM